MPVRVIALEAKEGLLKSVFISLVLLYAVLLLVEPALGPSDEYAFLPTLQSGKYFPMYGEDFPYYNSAEIGRFGPLGGQEYNLVAFFTNSPLGYFGFNAVELLLCAILLTWILRQYSSRPALVYLAGILLLLTPGFTLAYFKLLYVEKNVLFLLSAFVAAYLVFQQRQQTVFFVLGLLCANVAIYYKEPVFAAIAVFAAGHLLLAWKTSSAKSRLLDGLLVTSALIYIGVYLATVWPHHGAAIYAPAAADNNLMVLTRNIANYGFFSDPLPIFLLLPLLLWRLFRVVTGKDQVHPVLDPMLAAGMAYVAVFFVLNMYSPYYLLPAYLFALPPIVYFISRGELHGILWRACFAVAALVLVLNAIPLAIHYAAYYKYVPINFNKSVDFLVQDINRRYAGQRLSIFFDGVDRGNGRGVYFIAGEYLRFKGLSIRKFDFKSNMEARDSAPPVGRASPFDRPEDIEAVDPNHAYVYPRFPFSVYQPGPLQQIQSGDYLVVSPQGTKNFDDRYIESLEKDYDLVFRTHSPLAVPRFELKTFVKYLLSRKLSTEQKAGVMSNENMWNWPDYYVFTRR